MKSIFAIIISVILASNVAMAQQLKSLRFKLDNEINIKGDKVLILPFKNNGKTNQALIDDAINHEFKKVFIRFSKAPIKGGVNFKTWSLHPLFSQVDQKDEATTVIDGFFEETINEEKEEQVYYEKGTFAGGSIPYFEIKQTNACSLKVVINYRYSDKTTFCDTLFVQKESVGQAGKKLKSTTALLADCKYEIISKLAQEIDFIHLETVWFKFKSVKTSDKELKASLKLSDGLIEAGDIKTLGKIYKSIYESDNSNKEAAYNTGICYELIGNYPKAQEYYAQMPDFHTKVRMKDNLILMDYLNQIGAFVMIEDF